MTQINDQLIKEMVEKVLQHVQTGWGGRVAPTPGKGAAAPLGTGSYAPGSFAAPGPLVSAGQFGQFADVDQAVSAAKTAQKALVRMSLAQREIACDLIRNICTNRAQELGDMEYEETKLGHKAHKTQKLLVVGREAAGTKALRTECFSGDHGITLEEHAAWGVIGVVTPVTHSLPTLATNAVNMLAAGNSLVCNPHPSGKRIAAFGAKLFNQAIYEKLGIDNLICVITEPTIQSAQAIFKHPDVRLIVVTGGPGVVAEALRSGKRAVCAGPGNPPVVVDASADIENAAQCIIEGASFDNNLLCLSEKECFVEAPVFEKFMSAMEQAGAFRLTPAQIDKLSEAVLVMPKDGHPVANRKFVGAEPQVLGQAIGLNVPASCRLLYGEVKSASHPLIQAEQMTPVLPVFKCDTFEQAVDCAKDAEHGFGHTAVIHSRLVDNMTYMGKAMDTTLFVKNGPSVAGNGAGGEGYTNFTLACSTGEGVVTPLTYTRFRRCSMIDNLRII
jgi:aldehyde dehydrogenase